MTEDFVTIATCQFVHEAEACKMCLEAEGVDVFLADIETIRNDWAISNAIGGVKVQVPSSQAQNATSLLEQIRQRHDEHSKHTDEDFCLACGVVIPKDSSKCSACGWSYAKDE